MSPDAERAMRETAPEIIRAQRDEINRLKETIRAFGRGDIVPITDKDAEIERLRVALKPFVDAADLLERNSYVEGSDLILRQNGVILGHAPVQTRDLIAAKRVYEQQEDRK